MLRWKYEDLDSDPQSVSIQGWVVNMHLTPPQRERADTGPHLLALNTMNSFQVPWCPSSSLLRALL